MPIKPDAYTEQSLPKPGARVLYHGAMASVVRVWRKYGAHVRGLYQQHVVLIEIDGGKRRCVSPGQTVRVSE